ncbi:MAG: alcohol dehydrogenase [Synergistes sp.]|nr:alcohol dehydrogenase [Synergistes sp.]
MYVVACQKCGELKVLAGTPSSGMIENFVWTCGKCGTGQLITMKISKNIRRGDLRDIVRGLKLSRTNDTLFAPLLTKMKY